MYVKPQILTLQAYTPGKPSEVVMREYGLDKVVKLASNENPFGCSPKVFEELRNVVSKFAIYPDGATEEISKKLANFLNIQPDQLIFGSGADEVIQMISRALLTKEHNIVQASQTFSQYAHHAVIEGAEVRPVPLVKGVHDLDSMLAQVDANTKIVWICNPNNPTGTYIGSRKLVEFLEKVPSTTFVVVDEAYVEYVSASDFPDTISLLNKFDNLIVLRTFSKAYGLASFRIGYGIGNSKLIQELNIARLPFNTSMLSQVAAIAALEDQVFIKNCVEQNKKGMEQYEEFFNSYGIEYYPSQANFIFVSLENSQEIFKDLESKGYIIRAFPNGIRITIGTAAENEGLILHLKPALTKNTSTI
ncbi:histidinol-phosphate transaminase [Bacillus sp. AFS029533]|uniref:histidinol-phosphate transaminase n=1 Tax=Bacillus sp. AFS029533 TaxID=2033494 RepID=UPI000BFE5F2E|nr:histidinol-phosphate transaminase [Bacillus sp. AFS029533]PGZ90827.1 histidinol-phosphate transaminase [Bacillus sp. AFS029533]